MRGENARGGEEAYGVSSGMEPIGRVPVYMGWFEVAAAVVEADVVDVGHFDRV